MLSAPLLSTFLLSQGKADINEHSHAYNTGVAEQVQQLQTYVCFMVPEKPANAMSEILKSENFLCFVQVISYLIGSLHNVCQTNATVLPLPQ